MDRRLVWCVYWRVSALLIRWKLADVWLIVVTDDVAVLPMSKKEDKLSSSPSSSHAGGESTTATSHKKSSFGARLRKRTCTLNFYGRPMYYIFILFMAALCNRGAIIFLPCNCCRLLSICLFSSPNLSGRRLDVYHTLTHGVALVRIRAGFSLSSCPVQKKCRAPPEYRPTEFTRHAQWQCSQHRHFVKDSHHKIICTQNRRCGVTGV